MTESHLIHEDPSTSNSSNNNNIVLTPVSKNKNINNRYENCENLNDKIFLFGNFDDSNDFKKTAHFFENNNNNNNNFNNNNNNNNFNNFNNFNNNFNINNNIINDVNNNNNNYNNNNNIIKTNCKTLTQNKKKITFFNNNTKINRNNLTKKIPHPITASTPRNKNNNNNNEKTKKILEKKNSFNNLISNKRPKSSKIILKNNKNEKIKLTHKKVENEFNNVLTIIPKELLSDPEVKDKFNKIIKNINELKKVVSDKKVKKH